MKIYEISYKTPGNKNDKMTVQGMNIAEAIEKFTKVEQAHPFGNAKIYCNEYAIDNIKVIDI